MGTMTENAYQLDEEIQRELDAYYEHVAPENDPQLKLKGDVLRVFVLRDGDYQELERPYLSRIGLGFKLWDGVFEDREDTWLRWCDEQVNVILTGEERARMEAERADYEAAARREAEDRAAHFAAKLRELGVDPDQL